MRIGYFALIVGVTLGVLGFSVAVLLDKRQLGMVIFLVGFFIGAASAVSIILSSVSSNFGKIGMPIKIAAGGFGLIVIGQLLAIVLSEKIVIGNMFFIIGIATMLVGILAATVRLFKH